MREPRELPDHYGADVLVLMPRDPAACVAYWEISPATRNRLAGELGEGGLGRSRLILRILRPNQEPLVQEVSGPTRWWTFEPGCPGARIRGELGLEMLDRSFRPLLQSAEVEMPRRELAAEDPEWPAVAEVYARVRRALGEGA